MKIFIAGLSNHKDYFNIIPKYALESFYYFKDWQDVYIEKCDMFLFDSGAFTFLNTSKKNINWDDYVERYANFILKHKIKYFFELDIDSLIGIKEVERLRKKLEYIVGRKCIPVWHKNRGKEYFLKMCEDYDYIAIGGLAIKEIQKSQYIYLNWFLKEAHKRNCKVHGLGFTSMSYLNKIKFDSVDSTTWTNGSRFGELQYFEKGKIKRIPSKERKGKGELINKNNLIEWIKFQKWADKNL